MIFYGKVISVDDPDGGDRVKVRLKNADVTVLDADLPFASPLLPKILHVIPKVGEAVGVICQNDNPRMQRHYFGPLISQYQCMYKDYYDISALKLMNGPGATPYPSIENIPDTYGAFASKDDVAIYGRKNSDIILSDNDVRIRCGARLLENGSTTRIRFNRENPSLIKLKYYETPLEVSKPVWSSGDGSFSNTEKVNVGSSVSVIGQEINLISTEGDPYVNTSNTTMPQNGNESLSDDDLRRFIEKAHPLPFGDELVRLLHILIRAFKSHTHAYTQLPPVPDDNYNALDRYDLNAILSKNIRIN